MPMKSKTSITVSEALLEQLALVRDYLVASARRSPLRANPALLKGQVGLGTAVDELCRRYFRDMERQQRHGRRKHLDNLVRLQIEHDDMVAEEEEFLAQEGLG